MPYCMGCPCCCDRPVGEAYRLPQTPRGLLVHRQYRGWSRYNVPFQAAHAAVGYSSWALGWRAPWLYLKQPDWPQQLPCGWGFFFGRLVIIVCSIGQGQSITSTIGVIAPLDPAFVSKKQPYRKKSCLILPSRTWIVNALRHDACRRHPVARIP